MIAAVLCLVLSSTADPSAQDAADPLARGDAAWQRRSAGSEGAPDPTVVETAAAAYREAAERWPEDLEARWKLLRAVYFQGEYVAGNDEARLEAFTRARDLAEATLDLLARRVGGRDSLDAKSPAERAGDFADEPQAAEVFFWSAVAWGAWGDSVGRLKAARQGLAGRLRDLAATTVALDEKAEEAGGHRFLGRMHAEAPRIPLVTGWVDRDLALEHLERAVELAPRAPENRLFLAEAILDHHKGRRAEALEILRRLAAEEPRPEHRVEDTRTLEQAGRRLAAEEPRR